MDELQRRLDEKLRSVSPLTSTCSTEFLSVLDELERTASEVFEKRFNWRRVDLPSRRGSDDLVIATYLAGNLLVEIGIRGFNRCAPVGELVRSTGGARVYARLHAPGVGVVGVVEADSEAKGRERLGYII